MTITHNPYWKMAAHGGVLPSQMDHTLWQQAYSFGMKQLTGRAQDFMEHPEWASYTRMGEGLARVRSLVNIMNFVTTFLPGVSASKRAKALTQGENDINQTLCDVAPYAHAFLQSSMEKREERNKASYEEKFWYGISKQKAKCVAIEQSLERDGGYVQFNKLESLKLMPAARKKFRDVAKDFGWDGYAVDPTDTLTPELVRLEENEDVRRDLWEMMQHNLPITQQEIKKLLDARRAQAQENGYETYMDFLGRYNRALPFHTVEKQALRSLQNLYPIYEQLNELELQCGLTESTWKPKADSDIHQPWNKDFLTWAGEDGIATLNGKEFPLQHVMQTIIPDLFLMGGWQVHGHPEKVGRGKKSLYLYRMHRDGKQAMCYIAPFPASNALGNDSYQAYAAMLRERWTNHKQTTPVAIISANFELQNGGISDIDHLGFIAHEIGHVLHFFSFPGETFEEMDRMPAHVSELPSILMERTAFNPDTLAKWCHSKWPAGKKTSYWTKRIFHDPLSSRMNALERYYLDIRAHRLTTNDLIKQRKDLFKSMGAEAPHYKDRTAYTYFDRTENAGLYSCYGIGDALATFILQGKNDQLRIQQAITNLTDHVLKNHNHIEKSWKSHYKDTMHSMFQTGSDMHDQAYIKRAKSKMTKIRKKMKKSI